MGEVGGRLASALERAGWRVHAVTRRDGWKAASDPSNPAPRLVAVREEQLADVLERLAKLPAERLVLVQNGFLEAVHGDLGPVSRGLIWFTSKGDFFRSLCASPVHGTVAPDLTTALAAGGLEVELEPDRKRFTQAMIVKGIWNAVVGLPLAVHQVDLATYLSDHREELAALVEESARAAGAVYGVDVSAEHALDKLLATTTELGWVRGGAKALDWRNGALATFGRRHDVPTPVNDRLLQAVGHDPGAPG